MPEPTIDFYNTLLHMPKQAQLAIVGSTELTGATARYVVQRTVDILCPDTIVSGGAPGIDTLAEEEADRRGIPKLIHIPKEKNWARGFKQRNLLIVRDCTALVRIAWRFSKTYGSGWTRDRARAEGKPCAEFIISAD